MRHLGIFLFLLVSNFCFSQTLLFDTLLIDIPSEFKQIDSTELDNKYADVPYKPYSEYFSLTDSVTFTISDTLNPLFEKDVEPLRAEFESHFRELYPKADWLDTKTTEINNLTVAYLETLDNEIYYLVFFTSIDGKQIHFGFSSKTSDFDETRKLGQGMLNSIKIKK